MKTFPVLTFLSIVAISLAAAQAPAVAPAAIASAEAPTQDPLRPGDLRRYSLDRYDGIVKKSPFAFEIFAPEGPSTGSAFADWKLAGYTIDEGKGAVYATLLNEKSGDKAVVDNLHPHKTLEIQLVQLEIKDDWRQSKVRLRKGRDEEVIEFSKKALETRPTVAAVAAPQQGQQQQRAGLPPGVNPAAMRGNNIQGQINQNIAGQQGQQGQPGQPGQPGVNQPPQANPQVPNQQPQNAQVGVQGNQVGMGGRQGGPQGQQNSQPRRRVILPPPTNR
jgi:hypothetical protein